MAKGSEGRLEEKLAYLRTKGEKLINPRKRPGLEKRLSYQQGCEQATSKDINDPQVKDLIKRKELGDHWLLHVKKQEHLSRLI